MKPLLIAFMAVVFAVPAHAASELPVLSEVRAAFTREVGGIAVDEGYYKKVLRKAEDTVRQSQARFSSSQFFLLVDRNRAAQKAFLAFYEASEGKVSLVGLDNVSTGNPSRRGHFETPIGVFENKPGNMSYRALGTRNKLGWRGFGTKGSRVWDLGWQRTVRGRGEPMDIRMLVHATDPDYGEQRLGTVQSKGCIRISARFNRFLDQYGFLDRRYEESVKAKYVLLSRRSPMPFAGSLIIVIDSAVSEPASAEAGSFYSYKTGAPRKAGRSCFSAIR